MTPLGLIAGGGDLPVALARHCRAADRPVFIVRLAGFADPPLRDFPGVDLPLGALGAAIKALRSAGCQEVAFAGLVRKPDFGALRVDGRGLRALPRVIAAARRGDDALLRALADEFAREGFTLVGAETVTQSLTLTSGRLGALDAPEALSPDIDRAFAVARAIGRLDVGQAAVCAAGRILAVEAADGTDAMLRRLMGRGRGGVLAKAPKPGQDRRIDLPVVGPRTVRLAAEAGLAGIAGEAGQVLVLDRDGVIAAADAAGLFVIGVAP